MAGGYDNTNRGVLFKNDKKDSDSHPDYRGSVNVKGVEYWFSGWVKTAGPNARNPGSKFLSVSVKEKDEQPAEQKPYAGTDDMDGDVPF